MKYITNYFTNKECKKIINLSKTYKNYGFNYEWYKNTYDKDNRRQKGTSKFQAYLIPNAPYTKWIFDKIQIFFEETTEVKFKKDLIQCQLYKYVEGDEFQKHIDLTNDFPKRRWNLGVNLNENYEGGDYLCWTEDVEDENVMVIPKISGTICLYHSRQLHEIKKITKGIRWSLVIKVESDYIQEKKQFI